MSEETKLSEAEELFLSYLETSSTIKGAAEAAGVSADTGYAYAKKLKEVILSRAKEKLAVGTLKATTVVLNMMGWHENR